LKHERKLIQLSRNTLRFSPFTFRAASQKETTMKKFAIITAAALVTASVSGAYAQGTAGPSDQTAAQTSHHKAKTNTKPGMTTGSAAKSSKSLPGNNAELKGDSATSAGGANSLANTNNPGGMGNNAGPPMK
jgi:hypothetical protein